MSLTMGSGPFGQHPAGHFNVDIPFREVLFADPSPRRLRARRGAETVLDSRRAKLLHQHGALPLYFFPRDDVRWDLLGDVEPVEPPDGAPGLEGHGTFAWGDLGAWFEEGEGVVGQAVAPSHPVYVPQTPRPVVVAARAAALAESTRASALFETGLPPRWYLPREDV